MPGFFFLICHQLICLGEYNGKTRYLVSVTKTPGISLGWLDGITYLFVSLINMHEEPTASNTETSQEHGREMWGSNACWREQLWCRHICIQTCLLPKHLASLSPCMDGAEQDSPLGVVIVTTSWGDFAENWEEEMLTKSLTLVFLPQSTEQVNVVQSTYKITQSWSLSLIRQHNAKAIREEARTKKPGSRTHTSPHCRVSCAEPWGLNSSYRVSVSTSVKWA